MGCLTQFDTLTVHAGVYYDEISLQLTIIAWSNTGPKTVNCKVTDTVGGQAATVPLTPTESQTQAWPSGFFAVRDPGTGEVGPGNLVIAFEEVS